MMEQTTPKKTAVKKTTKKKLLPSYNYGQLTLDEVKQLGKYFVTELQKIEKAAPGLVPEIGKLLNKPTGQTEPGRPLSNTHAAGTGDYFNTRTQTYGVVDTVSHPTMKLPAIGGINPPMPGVAGSTMDMPMFSGIVPKPEIMESAVVEDNSDQLSAEIGALLNQ